jgi:hypothetical protein
MLYGGTVQKPLHLQCTFITVLPTLNLPFWARAYKVYQDIPFCVRLEAGKSVNPLPI